ncbi:hypothetical protein VXS03_11675 [Photobacterium sp. S4TG1]|uniref:hypothetical protein n=1 Tax=Photobacterium sp. S4TG1 TaxID=3114587 RepID=UPI002E16D989|nr:hypothetical protein [Photobacterium sp. S4TG1]
MMANMDIERFSANSFTTVPGVLTTQPTTIEMTGFSDSRCYLEQQTGLRRCPADESGVWASPLDN